MSLTSTENGQKLRRNVQVEGRVKTDNQCGYYIVDSINEAIDQDGKYYFIRIMMFIRNDMWQMTENGTRSVHIRLSGTGINTIYAASAMSGMPCAHSVLIV